MIASLFSVNSVAEVLDSCQGYDIKASCQASRQSLSGITQDWSIADGQWVIFSGMANNASGGAVFLQQSAEFTISPQNETGMTCLLITRLVANIIMAELSLLKKTQR